LAIYSTAPIEGKGSVVELRQLGRSGIHPWGNFNGFVEPGSKKKWLEAHGESHWGLFSSSLPGRRIAPLDNGCEAAPSAVLAPIHCRYRSESSRRNASAGPSHAEWRLACQFRAGAAIALND
jgi:hypothetical protein